MGAGYPGVEVEALLEIWLLILLCRTNANNAALRGRSKGGTIAYTIALWLVPEFVGGFIGGMVMAASGSDSIGIAYLFALLLAAAGALASYLVAKRGAPIFQPGLAGNLSAPEMGQVAGAQPLRTMCTVVIMRDSSFVGSAVGFQFTLNGHPLGSLRNNGSLQVMTPVLQNVLVATDAMGMRLGPALTFFAPEGGRVEAHFKGNRFVPELTLVTDATGARLPYQPVPLQPVGYPMGAVPQQAPPYPQGVLPPQGLGPQAMPPQAGMPVPPVPGQQLAGEISPLQVPTGAALPMTAGSPADENPAEGEKPPDAVP